MKRLHRSDLLSWSEFAERLDIDFNSFLWVRDGGNIAIDPLPQRAHDRKQLLDLGPLRWIVITNSAHVRGAAELAAATGAQLAGPASERGTFPIACHRWLADKEELLPGLTVHALRGSKTDGELALVLDHTTAIFGDLVRSHRAGTLMILSAEQGLKDRDLVIASLEQLVTEEPKLEALLLGDGWCEFREGHRLLAGLVASLRRPTSTGGAPTK